MCGITFASFTDNSTLNMREIARQALLGIENRGPQATGIAWLNPSDKTSVSGTNRAESAKDFVRSRAMRLMPDTCRTFIGHTRYATKGSIDNPLNNHPVFAYAATGEAVAAVHNGGVWNDDEAFKDYNLPRYAQVDSEIIPQMIAAYGSDDYASIFNVLEGGIATLWLDERTPDTLHAVRASDSPLVVATIDYVGPTGDILKGVIGASTTSTLTRILDTLGLSWNTPGVQEYAIGEGEYLSVSGGIWNPIGDIACAVQPFELPDLMTMWGAGWRGRNAKTQGSYSSSASSTSSSTSTTSFYGTKIGTPKASESDAKDGGPRRWSNALQCFVNDNGPIMEDFDVADSGRAAVLEASREEIGSRLANLANLLDDDGYVLSADDRKLIDEALDADIDVAGIMRLPSESKDGTDKASTGRTFVSNPDGTVEEIHTSSDAAFQAAQDRESAALDADGVQAEVDARLGLYAAGLLGFPLSEADVTGLGWPAGVQ